MKFDIITIFPHIFNSYFNESIIGRAQEKKLIQIKIHSLRNFSADKHKEVALRQGQGNREPRRTVDDKPYGGGAGMVLMAEPILRAVSSIKYRVLRTKKSKSDRKTKVIILSAKGKQFNQKMAYQWAKNYNQLIFITGRYEGIDERVKQITEAEEISIGPYVLTDGDVATMVIISAITRLIPGVINWESLEEESFFKLLTKKEKNIRGKENLEYPHYTRPEVFVWPPPRRGKQGKKYRVPKVLLSGDHKKIEEWRRRMSK